MTKYLRKLLVYIKFAINNIKVVCCIANVSVK